MSACAALRTRSTMRYPSDDGTAAITLLRDAGRSQIH
jgi:hypothetical protein